MRNRKGFSVIEALIIIAIVAILGAILVGGLSGCSGGDAKSAVKKATANVKVGADGFTAEQKNVKARLEEENRPGAIKHLYVISAYSGQVIIYSTVRGKVTSSGKRLTPKMISREGFTFRVDINGKNRRTEEVLNDDGTYGSSGQYLYWWDTKGVYHQHYIAGGQIVHVSNKPVAVKSIIINMARGK